MTQDLDKFLVLQHEVCLGPLSYDEICWLYGREYLADDDLIMPPNAREAVLLRIYIDRELAPLVDLPTVLLHFECPTCGRRLDLPTLNVAYECPDCGEEFSPERLRALFFDRPHSCKRVGVPQLASMSGFDWVELLKERPDFIHFALLERLNGIDWLRLLRAVPSLKDYCHWNVLENDQWRTMLKEGLCDPDIAEFALAEPSLQIPAIVRQPDLVKYVNFSQYRLADWLRLLRKRPELAASYPQWCANLNSTQVIAFFDDFTLPEELLAMLPAGQLVGIDWIRLLIRHPRCAKFCSWPTVVRFIERLPNPDPTTRSVQMRDASHKYSSAQHSCAIGYPELAPHTEEIYQNANLQEIDLALTTEDRLLLYDFMNWEAHLCLDDFSDADKIAILAYHPDFGIVHDYWRKLTPPQAAELIVHAPSLFPELYNIAKKAITRDQWGYLLKSVPANTQLMDLIGKHAPLSFGDIICCRNYGSYAIRLRILRWYLFFLVIALIWWWLTR